MAKLVYGLNQSLDGYVDHMKIGPPDPALSRYFTEQARGLTGAVYGRRTYEIMRYWDDDHPDWDAGDRDFAAVWRNQRKWIVSRSLESVGPNATLIEDDFEAAIRAAPPCGQRPHWRGCNQVDVRSCLVQMRQASGCRSPPSKAWGRPVPYALRNGLITVN